MEEEEEEEIDDAVLVPEKDMESGDEEEEEAAAGDSKTVGGGGDGEAEEDADAKEEKTNTRRRQLPRLEETDKPLYEDIIVALIFRGWDALKTLGFKRGADGRIIRPDWYNQWAAFIDAYGTGDPDVALDNIKPRRWAEDLLEGLGGIDVVGKPISVDKGLKLLPRPQRLFLRQYPRIHAALYPSYPHMQSASILPMAVRSVRSATNASYPPAPLEVFEALDCDMGGPHSRLAHLKRWSVIGPKARVHLARNRINNPSGKTLREVIKQFNNNADVAITDRLTLALLLYWTTTRSRGVDVFTNMGLVRHRVRRYPFAKKDPGWTDAHAIHFRHLQVALADIGLKNAESENNAAAAGAFRHPTGTRADGLTWIRRHLGLKWLTFNGSMAAHAAKYHNSVFLSLKRHRAAPVYRELSSRVMEVYSKASMDAGNKANRDMFVALALEFLDPRHLPKSPGISIFMMSAMPMVYPELRLLDFLSAQRNNRMLYGPSSNHSRLESARLVDENDTWEDSVLFPAIGKVDRSASTFLWDLIEKKADKWPRDIDRDWRRQQTMMLDDPHLVEELRQVCDKAEQDAVLAAVKQEKTRKKKAKKHAAVSLAARGIRKAEREFVRMSAQRLDYLDLSRIEPERKATVDDPLRVTRRSLRQAQMEAEAQKRSAQKVALGIRQQSKIEASALRRVLDAYLRARELERIGREDPEKARADPNLGLRLALMMTEAVVSDTLPSIPAVLAEDASSVPAVLKRAVDVRYRMGLPADEPPLETEPFEVKDRPDLQKSIFVDFQSTALPVSEVNAGGHTRQQFELTDIASPLLGDYPLVRVRGVRFVSEARLVDNIATTFWNGALSELARRFGIEANTWPSAPKAGAARRSSRRLLRYLARLRLQLAALALMAQFYGNLIRAANAKTHKTRRTNLGYIDDFRNHFLPRLASGTTHDRVVLLGQPDVALGFEPDDHHAVSDWDSLPEAKAITMAIDAIHSAMPPDIPRENLDAVDDYKALVKKNIKALQAPMKLLDRVPVVDQTTESAAFDAVQWTKASGTTVNKRVERLSILVREQQEAYDRACTWHTFCISFAPNDLMMQHMLLCNMAEGLIEEGRVRARGDYKSLEDVTEATRRLGGDGTARQMVTTFVRATTARRRIVDIVFQGIESDASRSNADAVRVLAVLMAQVHLEHQWRNALSRLDHINVVAAPEDARLESRVLRLIASVHNVPFPYTSDAGNTVEAKRETAHWMRDFRSTLYGYRTGGVRQGYFLRHLLTDFHNVSALVPRRDVPINRRPRRRRRLTVEEDDDDEDEDEDEQMAAPSVQIVRDDEKVAPVPIVIDDDDDGTEDDELDPTMEWTRRVGGHADLASYTCDTPHCGLRIAMPGLCAMCRRDSSSVNRCCLCDHRPTEGAHHPLCTTCARAWKRCPCGTPVSSGTHPWYDHPRCALCARESFIPTKSTHHGPWHVALLPHPKAFATDPTAYVARLARGPVPSSHGVPLTDAVLGTLGFRHSFLAPLLSRAGHSVHLPLHWALRLLSVPEDEEEEEEDHDEPPRKGGGIGIPVASIEDELDALFA